MSTAPRLRALPALVLLAVTGAFLAGPALAEDKEKKPWFQKQWNKRTGKIAMRAHLEPKDLKPGQTGKLKIEAVLWDKLHVYAKGEQGLVLKPIKVDGVTYKEAFRTPSVEYKDEFDDVFQVWKKKFEFVFDVTVAATVKPGTEIGVAFTYYGCTDQGCYPPVKNHAVTARLSGGDEGKGAGGGGAAKDDGGKRQAKLTDRATDAAADVSLKIEGASADGLEGTVVVTFTPNLGFHLYGSDEQISLPIDVKPVKAEGVTWGKFTLPSGEKIYTPVKVEVPFQRTADVGSIALQVSWQGCDEMTCKDPANFTMKAVWQADAEEPAGPVAGENTTAKAVPADVLFPVVTDDDLGAYAVKVKDENFIKTLFDDHGVLAFGLIFLIGLGLAFTPCVLPIIPITVAVIGGAENTNRKQLTTKLVIYVLGLTAAFATLGLVASFGGASFSAAFEMPAVQWAIAIIFILLGFSMLGIYELQPPQWLMRMQGGAQRRTGSYVGIFLFGALSAIIASPCTAPVLAAMVLVTAETQDPFLGLAMFGSIGLGMGAVFFAFGALNFAARPGPWMVWVRFVFGALLFGAAFYYLASGGLISPEVLFAMGFATALLAWWGITWHLMKKEGEEPGPARIRGAKVAVMVIMATGLVAVLTRPAGDLKWTYVTDRDHLKREVDRAIADGKPVVVDFWATWCYYCKKYDQVIEDDPELRKKFEQVVRLKVDLTKDAKRLDLRHAVGAPQVQPYLVFLDKQGRIRRNADVPQWLGENSGKALHARIDLVLNSEGKEHARR